MNFTECHAQSLIFDNFSHATMASATWTFRVGFRDDPENIAGMTHLCEHLVADRSDTEQLGSQYRAAAAGVFVSATTYSDSTQVTIIALPEELAQVAAAFWRSAYSPITSTDLNQALSTVGEEVDESLGRLGGRREQWVELAETLGHGWQDSHDGFGYELDSTKVTLDDVRRHLDRFFVLSNATLSVSGDLDRIRFLALSSTQEFSGDINPPARSETRLLHGTIMAHSGQHIVALPVTPISDGLNLYVILLTAAKYLAEAPEFRFIGDDRDLSVGFFGPWTALSAEYLIIVVNEQSPSQKIVERLIDFIVAAMTAVDDGSLSRALALVHAEFAERIETPLQRTILLGQLASAGISSQGGLDSLLANVDTEKLQSGVREVLGNLLVQLNGVAARFKDVT